MKELIIAVTVLLAIFGASVYTNKNIKEGSRTLVNKLEVLKEDISKDDASKSAKEIYKEWEKISKNWSVMILHNELDLIETSLIRMKSSISSSELQRATEEIDVAIFLLGHIVEKERLSIKNIF